MRIVAITFIAVAFTASTATAQLTPQQQAAIASKSIVTVVMSDGTWTGRLTDLTADSVTIHPDGWPARTLPLGGVSRIEAKKRDSIGNGVLAGALIMGVMCLVNCGQGLDSAGDLPGTALRSAAMGAVIGAVIDAAHKATVSLYKRPAAVPARKPGVFFTVRF